MRPRADGTRTGASAKLNAFDVTSLVVGSIIGADVYVATAIGARLIGPSSLLVWVLAGAMAMVIALSFSYCVMILPKVGGPYAYVKEVAGPFPGFIVGWGLLLAEWFSLAVFPVAFTQYFLALDPGIDDLGKAVLKAVFIAIILVTNLVGIKAAGRVNDVLTVAKLSPLLLIVLGGFAFVALQPGQFAGNLVPFFTGDVSAFGRALVLIFWAYAGFELSTLPTDEVIQPRKTIPRAILAGMVIVIAFYFLTNFFVIGTVGRSALGASTSPLVDPPRTHAPEALERTSLEGRHPGGRDVLLRRPHGTRQPAAGRDLAGPSRDRRPDLHVLLSAEGTRGTERCVLVRGGDLPESVSAGAAVPRVSVAVDQEAPAEAFGLLVDLQFRPVFEDRVGPVVPGCAAHPASGMRAGAAQVQPLDRRAVVRPSAHRPKGEELVRPHLPVRLVRFRQPEA